MSTPDVPVIVALNPLHAALAFATATVKKTASSVVTNVADLRMAEPRIGVDIAMQMRGADDHKQNGSKLERPKIGRLKTGTEGTRDANVREGTIPSHTAA